MTQIYVVFVKMSRIVTPADVRHISTPTIITIFSDAIKRTFTSQAASLVACNEHPSGGSTDARQRSLLVTPHLSNFINTMFPVHQCSF